MGNTFGATALSSYGGFWLSFAVILTPGGFNIEAQLTAASSSAFADEFGLYLIVSQPFPTPSFGCLLTMLTGLVHFHVHATSLHSALDSRFLYALFHTRHGLHAPRYRLSTPRRHGDAKPTHYQGRRLFRPARGILGLVQCVGWYRR